MKRSIAIIVLLFSLSASAQTFQFGMKAGANFSNFTGGNFDDVKKKSIVGFHGGIFLRFNLVGFAIQPEAMISTQGARIDSVSGSYDWKVTYVTVPARNRYAT